LWGVGMGAQEGIARALIATNVAADRRAGAFGTYNACFGVAWFLGSALMGLLYDRSPTALIAFSVAGQLLAAAIVALQLGQKSASTED